MHEMGIAIRQNHAVTDEELLELSQLNPGYQIERDACGALIVTPSGMNSERRSALVVHRLAEWNEGENRGEVFGSSAGFALADGSVLSPDAAWVSRARWDALTYAQQELFGPLAPDAVFELRSRTDSLTELQAKMRSYTGNGVRVGVLIDPYDRIVEVYRPDADPLRVDPDGSVSLDPELPGFMLDLRPLTR